MKQELWTQLSKSAQEMLTRQAEFLVEGYTGKMELHCHKGGVRLLRLGTEYRPGEMEFRTGEDDSDR